MWPFGPKRGADGLATLPGRVEALEHDRKTLRLEWDDVLDRLERMAGRLAKREQRDAPVLSGPSPEARGNHAPPALPASRALAEVMKRRGMR